METIAKGKEEVLSYLDAHAIGRTGGKPGVYRLVRDDQDRLILIVAGQAFSGTHGVKLGPPGMGKLEVVNGIVVSVEEL